MIATATTTALLLFVAGVVSTIAIEELLRYAFRRAGTNARRSRFGRFVLRRRAAKILAHGDRWTTTIGRLRFPWVVAAYGPFAPENIESRYHSDALRYPPEIQISVEAVARDVAERRARGEEAPFNGHGYKLIRFTVSDRTPAEEAPRLVLHFGPTDFFHMLATDQRLDDPAATGDGSTLRSRYATNADLRRAPVPEFATHWGVGLAVLTSDQYLLVSERGNTAVDADVFFPAVAEGANRPGDSHPDTRAPDPLRTAQRGISEELGIELRPDELRWLSFGANSVLCEYALIGIVRSRYSVEEIRRRRSIGQSRDGWETARLHYVDFSPEEVATFMSDPERTFSPFGVIAILHALMDEFGVRDTEAAMNKAHVTLSQTLPRWLTHPDGD